MKLPFRALHLHSRNVGCAAHETECGVILLSKQLRGAELYGVRPSCRAKTAHNALNESADDLRQFPLSAVFVDTGRCHQAFVEQADSRNTGDFLSRRTRAYDLLVVFLIGESKETLAFKTENS